MEALGQALFAVVVQQLEATAQQHRPGDDVNQCRFRGGAQLGLDRGDHAHARDRAGDARGGSVGAFDDTDHALQSIERG